MIVLVGGRENQVVCSEFRKLGIETFSNSPLPSSGDHPEFHLEMDLREALELKTWDLGIFFTPCKFSCNSGIRWMYNEDKTINAERFSNMQNFSGMLRDSLRSNISFVACENPIPHRFAIEVIGRKYDQVIQPYQFGHGEQKATCLWLKNLPPLTPTNIVPGRVQKMWLMPPSEDRSKLRAVTYQGIAEAMAIQWTKYIENYG